MNDGSFIGAALDTETTGLSNEKDHIIEVAVQLFRFEMPGGRIIQNLESYEGLQDPGFAVSMETTSLTGISPSMLVDQKIDWERVDELLSKADVVLAHNARFDRGFVDRKSRVSPAKRWACTSSQADWRAKGFKNAKLQDVCGALGIHYEAHRAMSDVRAMVQLIGSEDVMTGKTYLAEVITNAGKEMAYLWVEGRTYDQRDLLKAHGFRWDGEQKIWGKFVLAADTLMEVTFVQSVMPELKILNRPVALTERFK
jgi:DNA polymerase-3 subunit epsilon